jgi:hypothetical protein
MPVILNPDSYDSAPGRVLDKLPSQAGMSQGRYLKTSFSISELGGNEFGKCLFQLLG